MFAGPGTLFLSFAAVRHLGRLRHRGLCPFMRKLLGAVRGTAVPGQLDLHNLLGIATVVWVLVVGVTGVINTLDRPLLGYWQMTEVTDMLQPWKGKPKPAALRPVDDAVRAAEAAEPDMAVRFVAFPATPFAGPHHYMVFMRGQTPLTGRLLKPLLIDVETAQVSAAKDMPWYLTALLLSQPLHFGDYGEMPLKILWALFDLLAIVVLLSGLYLWWKKRDMAEFDLVQQEQLLADGSAS